MEGADPPPPSGGPHTIAEQQKVRPTPRTRGRPVRTPFLGPSSYTRGVHGLPPNQVESLPVVSHRAQLESVLVTQGTTVSLLSDLGQALRASCLEDGAKIPFPLRPAVRSHSHQSPRWEGLLWTELVSWLLWGKETVRAALPSAARACATVSQENLPVISDQHSLQDRESHREPSTEGAGRARWLQTTSAERGGRPEEGPGRLSSPPTNPRGAHGGCSRSCGLAWLLPPSPSSVTLGHHWATGRALLEGGTGCRPGFPGSGGLTPLVSCT